MCAFERCLLLRKSAKLLYGARTVLDVARMLVCSPFWRGNDSSHSFPLFQKSQERNRLPQSHHASPFSAVSPVGFPSTVGVSGDSATACGSARSACGSKDQAHARYVAPRSVIPALPKERRAFLGGVERV